MCQNELFQSSRKKNRLFKVHEQKMKLIYSLRTKTISTFIITIVEDTIFIIIFHLHIYN